MAEQNRETHLFYRAKGTLGNYTVPVFGLIVIGLMFVATAKEVLWEEGADMDILVRQAAKEIASEVSALSTTDQGVRVYSLNWDFTVQLKDESVSASYTDAKGNVTIHEYPHTIYKGIYPAQTSGVGRLCISKKLDGCRATITICKEGEACCTISPSTCFFAG